MRRDGMKRFYCFLGIAGVIMSAASCQHSKVADPSEGSLSIVVRPETEETTRAGAAGSDLLSSADIRIYKDDFSGMVRHYRYSDMPSSVYLPSGGYRIDVVAGEAAAEKPALASWENKSYAGSETVSIQPSRVSNVVVTARVSNVVSNVSFDPTVEEFFGSDFSCSIGTVADDPSCRLVYTPGKSGQDGYFIASGFEPSLYWSFSGTLLSDGSTFTRTGVIPSVEAGKRYRLVLKYVEKNGIVEVAILVDNTLNDIYDDVVFVPVSTGISATGKYDIWGGHFTAYADVDEDEYDPAGVYFEYREKGGEAWTRTAAATRVSEGTYSSLISGLQGGTEYEYRLVVTNLSGVEETIEEISVITTEAAVQLPNSGFETLSHDESRNYYSFYDPASPVSELQSKWWCSGNQGSTTVGSSYQITYPDESDKKEGSRSVCLESRYVVVKFAAGNLFCGRFGKTIGTSGGTVYFGRPFTARPTAMRLWVKYSGGKIDRIQSGVPDGIKEGDYDRALLRVALGTWDYRKYGGDAKSPILVNTTDKSTFVDFSTDASTIAFGEEILVSDEADSHNSWKQITIPLEYRDTATYPTHIVVSFAASMYGDYFTGHTGSKLWLDQVELLYE